jgi:hypothetical protein
MFRVMSIARSFRLAALALAGAAALALQAQKPFPPLDGSNSQGEQVHLPATGSWSIIAVVASKKAQPALEQWFAPAYNRFVLKSGLFAGSYSVDLFLVPVFTGLDKAAYGPSMKALRKEVDADIARQVVFVKEDGDALLDALDLRDRHIPWFFTVDPKGNIVHTESGAFKVEKLDALEAPML